MEKLTWIVSAFSSFAGEIDASYVNGVAWSTNQGYWLWINTGIKSNGEITVTIDAENAPPTHLYTVIGYCIYHEIKYEIIE